MQIHFAAKRGDLAEVERQLSIGRAADAREFREGWTPLMFACSSCRANADVVRLLLSHGADPNYASSPLGDTPLRQACMCGQLDKVNLLLDSGADPLSISPSGYTPVIDAVYGNGPDVVPILKQLAKLGADLDQETAFGESALKVAWKRCSFGAVRTLINCGADTSSLQLTPLMTAVVFGTTQEVEDLLKSGVELSSLDCWGRSAWHLALSVGEVEKARHLLNAGADLHQTGHCGKTNLMYAVRNDSVDMVRWLLEMGAKARAVDDFGDNALMVAASHGAARCVQVLVDAGVPVHHADETGSSAIDRAANAEVVRVLAAAGADIDHVNGEGYCLLRIAAEEGREEVVEALLRRGANTEPDDAMEFPLHAAIEADELGCVRMLLGAGADPDLPNMDGDPPVMSVRSLACLELLEEYGADLTACDDLGRNALCRVRDEELVSELLRMGCDVNPPEEAVTTPLIVAAEQTSPSRVRLLLQNDAQVNVRLRDGRTPLMAAAQAHCHECVDLLLEAGAYVDERDVQGRTALHRVAAPDAFVPEEELTETELARKGTQQQIPEELRLPGYELQQADSDQTDPNSAPQIIRQLLKAGAELSARDAKGTTPLMLASSKGSPLSVRALLESGGNAAEKDSSNRNSLDYASQREEGEERNAVLRLLRVTIS